MGLFDAIADFFNPDPSGYEGLKARRKEVKDKFYQQLKTQLFMSDEEASAVIMVIEKYEEQTDDVMAEFNVYNHSIEQANDMHEKLLKIQTQMRNEVKGIVTFLMRKKAENAKKALGDYSSFGNTSSFGELPADDSPFGKSDFGSSPFGASPFDTKSDNNPF